MNKEDRYKILWIGEKSLLDLLLSPSFISNLPADVQVDAVCHDFTRRAFGLRIWSKEFKIMPPYGHLPEFDAEVTNPHVPAYIAKHKQERQYRPKLMIGCFNCGTMVEQDQLHPPPEGMSVICHNCHLTNGDSDTPTIVQKNEG